MSENPVPTDRATCCRSSERGIAFISALVLSTLSLIVISALLYMITIGTRTSGMQKRYRTALEAGLAGMDVMTQFIALRGDDAAANALVSALNQSGMKVVFTTATGCSGAAYKLVTSGTGSLVTGQAAKTLSAATTWHGCDASFKINPADTASYDLGIQVGSNPAYAVYAKIVDTVEGNTGSNSNTNGNKLIVAGVSSSPANNGEITTMSLPYQYTIEISAENTKLTSPERAKLSVLYQN